MIMIQKAEACASGNVGSSDCTLTVHVYIGHPACTRCLLVQMKPSGTAFLAAVSQMEDVMGDNRVTVFAPTNEAFTSAAQKFGGNLPESDVADVCLILSEHHMPQL